MRTDIEYSLEIQIEPTDAEEASTPTPYLQRQALESCYFSLEELSVASLNLQCYATTHEENVDTA